MITINKLDKHYGSQHALKSIDIRIAPGRITAVLGPNGAGKTTLIKCILGLVKPDSGQISVDGIRVNGESDYRRMIGYMPQLARYPENLTVSEIVEMICDVRGWSGSGKPDATTSSSDSNYSHKAHDTHNAHDAHDVNKTHNGHDLQNRHNTPTGLDWDLWHRFNLDSEKNKTFRTLSGGNRQKVSAVLAFLFRPKILFLDEPTAGLDPVSSSIFKDKILEERDRGTTVILTSHIMSEVQDLSETVVYLLEGRLHFERGVEEILAETGQKTLERAIAKKLDVSSGDNDEINEAIVFTEKIMTGGVL